MYFGRISYLLCKDVCTLVYLHVIKKSKQEMPQIFKLQRLAMSTVIGKLAKGLLWEFHYSKFCVTHKSWRVFAFTPVS